jgi:hypothetical protein
MKDEREDYIREWLDYHFRIGVDIIHIYDNNSAMPLKELLKDVNNLSVTLLPSTSGNRQPAAYKDFIKHFTGHIKWAAFIDCDEFIVVRTPPHKLPQFLANYDKYGGVGLNWLFFGTNNLIDNPSGSQINAFTKRKEDADNVHKHIKSIVQLEFADTAIEGHTFSYKHGKYCVNELHHRINGNGPFSPLTYTYANINHYYFRSRNDYLDKIRRGPLSSMKGVYTTAHLDADKHSNIVEDSMLVNIYKNLKKEKKYKEFYNEAKYLKINPDVQKNLNYYISGMHHYLTSGRHEGRKCI